MAVDARAEIVRLIAQEAQPLTGDSDDYDELIELVQAARYVLLGEATHGTHEFYRERATITKRLIAELGFRAVAIEGDWPDAYRVNRYVQGHGKDRDAEEALQGFRRFPTWMWRNADVLDFVGWLREYNQGRKTKAGFYGLDLYSLFSSADAVIKYLERIDKRAVEQARRHYACFDYFGPSAEAYAHALEAGRAASCEDDVVAVLGAMRAHAMQTLEHDGLGADEAFHAAQNAKVVANAERYYRTMFDPHVSSWSVRDRHMAETLQDLSEHLSREGSEAKIVVWAHNSHVGDARTTDMLDRHEVNIGQLCREAYGDKAFLLGFTTHTGTVTAARNWHEAPERRRVRPARRGSVELLLHEVGIPAFFLDMNSDGRGVNALAGTMLERAIGVVYRPETELLSHYLQARPRDQFDALIHIDHTRAVEPLERTAEWEAGEVPETFPSGV